MLLGCRRDVGPLQGSRLSYYSQRHELKQWLNLPSFSTGLGIVLPQGKGKALSRESFLRVRRIPSQKIDHRFSCTSGSLLHETQARATSENVPSILRSTCTKRRVVFCTSHVPRSFHLVVMFPYTMHSRSTPMGSDESGKALRQGCNKRQRTLKETIREERTIVMACMGG